MDELKPCPHCGKIDTVGIATCVELEECENFECCESDGYVCVVCDVNKGGCGAAGGYAPSEEEAAEKWNRRAAPENKPLTVDELHHMVGDPVYVKDIPPYNYAAWKVINDIDDKQIDFTEGEGYEL